MTNVGDILGSSIATPQAAVNAADAVSSSRVDAAVKGEFDSLMRVSFEKADGGAKSVEEQVRGLANQLVSVSLIRPMLSQARQSPFRSDLFHGGHGEEMFQQHLDTVIADRMAQRMTTPLADAIYRRINRMMTGADAAAVDAPRLDQHG